MSIYWRATPKPVVPRLPGPRSRPLVWSALLTLFIAATWLAAFVVGITPAVRVLTLTALGLAVLGLRWPGLGLVGISMICVLDGISRSLVMDGGLLRWNTFNYLLIGAAALYVPMLLRLNDIHTRLYELFALLYLLAMAFTPDSELGFENLMNVLALPGLMVYLGRAAERPRIWFWNGLICGVLSAGGGLIYYMVSDPALESVNKNVAATFWVTGLFTICFAMAVVQRRRDQQLVLLALAVINLIWVFLSASRGNLLIALACMLFLLIEMRSLRLLLFCAALGAVVGTLAIGLFAEREAESLHTLTELFNEDQSVSGRTNGRSDLALGGWYIFLDNPLGVGTGGYNQAWSELDLREGISGFEHGQPFPAHSGWIKTLAEQGVLGILLLGAYIGSFALVGLRRGTLEAFSIGLLASLGFGLALLTTEFQAKGLWFLTAAATVFLYRDQIVGLLRAAERREPLISIVRARQTPPDEGH